MDETQPVVRTAGGQVRGRTEADVAVFRGIPFARPPVGGLRFAAPLPAEPWDGVREAVAFGPPPPQSGSVLPLPPPSASGADPDDWLTVNVFSPDLGAARLPVMVWIYGGAYRSGAASNPGYDGTLLARQNVVVVTFNHRVGVEGYAYLPGVPANRALLDQVAALRWVRENIAGFGGDPNRVTVGGQSAGGMSVHYLTASPLAKGLFQRAIVESGGSNVGGGGIALNTRSLADAEAAGKRFADSKGAASIKDLRAMSWQDLTKPVPAPAGGRGGGGGGFSPIVDGYLLLATVSETMAQGKFNDVATLTGVNAGELG